MDYLIVTRLVLVYSCGLISYSPHKNELVFSQRLIEAKGVLHLPFDLKTPSGPTIGDEQGKMMDWLSSPVHGEVEFWNEDQARPADIQFQAMFYGFSDDPPERVGQWLDSVLGINGVLLSRA